MSPKALAKMAAGSAAVDGFTVDRWTPVTLFESEAYKHAVLSKSAVDRVGRNNALADALNARQSFVDGRLNEASSHLSRARGFAKQKQETRASREWLETHFQFRRGHASICG